MLELLALIWFLIGFFGYIYVLTLDFDLYATDLVFAIISGLLGPVGFGIMCNMYKRPIVILKKRLK